MRGFCVFDLDGTLVDFNTTYHFISFVLARKSKRRFLAYELLSSPISALCHTINRIGLASRDLRKETSARFLKGTSYGEIERLGRVFCKGLCHTIETSDRSPLHEMLTRARAESDVYILSRTLVPLEALGSCLAVKVMSSRLNHDDSSKADGTFAELNKKDAMYLLAAERNLAYKMAVSDSPEDLVESFPFRLLVINSRIPWIRRGYNVKVVSGKSS